MPHPFRLPLPTIKIADLITGHDTRAQSAENMRRYHAYIDFLREHKLRLPSAPKEPKVLGIAQLAREAGLSVGVLRTTHPIRKMAEAAIAEFGLAIVVQAPISADLLSIEECRIRFAALAPSKAAQIGITAEGMQKFVSDLFNLMLIRADLDKSAPALPVVRQMREDAKADLLGVSMHVARIIQGFDDWLAEGNDLGGSLPPEALAAMEFHDLLRYGLEKVGMSPAQVGALSGVRQGTVWKWMNEGRAPNRRNHPGLRTLSVHFGLPEAALINSIRSGRAGADNHLWLNDFPEIYRQKKFKNVRDGVKALLDEDDWLLASDALAERIADLCKTVGAETENARRRKNMRDHNKVDRTKFPPKLVNDMATFQNFLIARQNDENTQTAYLNHLEGFFHFALSGNAPDELRLDPATVSLSFVASCPLWEAFFTHRSAVGRMTFEPGFKINRSSVERMTSVISLFDKTNGLFKRDAALFNGLKALGASHLPLVSDRTPSLVLLAHIQTELSTFKKDWMVKSKKPIAGRDEISDLLAWPDPLIAVRQTVAYLRKRISCLRKYQYVRGDGTSRINHHYATAMRKLILIHLLGQTALRIGMFPHLTVGNHPFHHLQALPGHPPTLLIPASMFKNADSEVFKEGPYTRTLQDIDGFYEDLREYLDVARPRLLDGARDDHLMLSWTAGHDGKAVDPTVLRHEIAEITRNSVGSNAPPSMRLIQRRSYLRPHHFRDILATSVLHRTDRNYALAGDAIHVTEQTARSCYAHDSVALRRPQLDAVMQGIAAERHVSPGPVPAE